MIRGGGRTDARCLYVSPYIWYKYDYSLLKLTGLFLRSLSVCNCYRGTELHCSAGVSFLPGRDWLFPRKNTPTVIVPDILVMKMRWTTQSAISLNADNPFWKTTRRIVQLQYTALFVRKMLCIIFGCNIQDMLIRHLIKWKRHESNSSCHHLPAARRRYLKLSQRRLSITNLQDYVSLHWSRYWLGRCMWTPLI